MRERTMAIGRIVALVVATSSIVLFRPIQSNLQQALNVDVIRPTATAVAATPQPSTSNSSVSKIVAKEVSANKPQPEKPAEPPRPTPWAVQTSPNGGTDYVNKALSQLQDMGLTKQGAAMLVGNFLQEMPSAFTTGNPCSSDGYSDGGLALGFGQWHPGRRTDMPCDFSAQLTWAVNTEMARDGGGKVLRPLLFDQNATAAQIDYGIRLWERYGVKGDRYQYGVDILSQLN